MLTLLHSSPPPEAIAVRIAAAHGDVSLAAGDDAGAARPVDNRVSRSDDAVPTSEATTTVAVTTPTTAARAARARTTRTTVKPVQKAAVRQATPATKPAPKPAPKPAATAAPSSSTAPAPSGRSQSGGATWYDAAPPGTCAHRTLPLGTIVNIRSSSGATASCRVSDRGPFVDGLIIDLAKDVFTRLAPLSQGVVQVTISW